MADKTAKLRAVVLGRLESLQRAGVAQLPRAVRPTGQPPAADVDETPVEPPTEPEENIVPKRSNASAWQARGGTLFESDEPSGLAASEAATLPLLQAEVAACTRCDELADTRTQTVFGVGDPQARLCFMGEAPGADEDRQGEPFVGRAGQLLTKIIEACKLQREEVYILNMLKCRPPGNRNPLPHELANCRGYLERQLELIEPEFICCLGAVAAQNLLDTTTSIGRLRGKLHAYRGAKVVCTYHPAYLLRNPAAKKDAWEDMKFLMHEMGVEL